MRGVLLWATSVLVLWWVPWPNWFPGGVDLGGELKLGLSIFIAVLAAFLLALVINLILAPIRIDAESQQQIENLSSQLTPLLKVRPSKGGRTQNIEHGGTTTSISGRKQTAIGPLRGDIIAIEVINPTNTLIKNCEASVISVELADPEKDKDAYIQSNGGGFKKDPWVVDPIPLAWVRSGGAVMITNIPSGAIRRLQVVIHLGDNLHFMTDKLPANYIHFFKRGFDYILRISINAENTAATFVTARLSWKDNLSYEISEIDRDDGIRGLLEPVV